MKKFIENTTAESIFVGGKLLGPGEGREFDAHELPPEHREAAPVEAAPAPGPDDGLIEALKQPVHLLVGEFPATPIAALQRLRELESQAEKPRKSLLAAIDAELLQRGSDQLDGGAKA